MTNKKPEQNNEHYQSRRDFLKNSGLVVGGVAGGSLLGGLFTSQFKSDNDKQNESKESESKENSSDDKKNPARARMFFARYEDLAVLAAATELIFPEDDNGPGAIGLDVPYFIDKQLAGTWGVNDDDYRQGPFDGEIEDLKATDKANHVKANRGMIFLDGLRTMNAESKKRFDTSFDEASEEQQGEIMSALEKGKLKMKTIPSDGFFDLLKQATMEGAFCDPLYGGNLNMDGWRMKEFPGAQMSYANVIEEEEFVEMDPVSLTDYQQSL